MSNRMRSLSREQLQKMTSDEVFEALTSETEPDDTVSERPTVDLAECWDVFLARQLNQ